ncbi:MAG TPA: ABC transporter ATP-binding protein [Gaiellaceae bacterium]|nr:ABC transporter ATP-binding protein [Gaiellaceae bacterium]
MDRRTTRSAPPAGRYRWPAIGVTLDSASPASSAPALSASGLCKRFGTVAAIAGVDLQVDAGEVRGLLGPNGAGKTTLLRMLLGLVRPDEGRIELFGQLFGPGVAPGSRRVVGFVEEPRFYPYLSARRTLELLGELDGAGGKRRVGELLGLVGLTKAAGQRVGSYSTGMRQRLGIAASLLASPRALLLDEPTSGLDPAGAREMRGVVRRLADEGVAVLLSSHDMDEVADVCDSVTILASGRVVWHGTIERLRAEAPAPEHRLETSDDAKARELGSASTALEVREDARGGLVVTAERDALDAFVLALAAEGVAVRRLDEIVSSFESMFLTLIEGAAG